MKKLLVVIFILLTVGASAQLSIKGKVRTLRPITIKIVDMAGESVLECEVKNSEDFKTKKVAIKTDMYIMHIGESTKPLFLTENSAIEIKGFVNDKDLGASNLIFEGVDENAIYLDVLKRFQASKCSIDLFHEVLKENPRINPVIFAAVLKSSESRLKSYEIFKKTLDLIPVQKQDAQVVDYVKAEIKKREHYAIGQTVEDFVLADKDGREVRLSDFAGKMVLLDFWASWCGPCRAEMKSLHKIYDELKGDDLVFISISLDDDRGKWLKAMQEDAIPWVALWDKDGFKKTRFQKQFGFTSIPFIVLIDKQGVAVGRRLRGDDVKVAIENLRKK